MYIYDILWSKLFYSTVDFIFYNYTTLQQKKNVNTFARPNLIYVSGGIKVSE